MNRKKKAQQLVDAIKNECNNLNIGKAWEIWCELFALCDTPSTASFEQRIADCIELHSFLQQITNEEVYAITDYGKDLYYTQIEK